jgi:hypothetical protein
VTAPERCKHARKAVVFYRGQYHAHRARLGAGRPTTTLGGSTAACSQVRFLAYMWRSRAYVARVSADALALFRAVKERQNREARERRQLYDKWECIHKHEGAWNSNTGNGYYGGLQMDMGFQSTYGSEFMRKWGTANNWPVWAQIKAAERAYHGYRGVGGRGFSPWPNTSRMCGL